MSQDLKIAYRIVLTMLALAMLLSLTGIIRPPYHVWHVKADLSVANLGTYGLGFVLLYAFSRPGWQEARRIIAIGTVLAGLAVATQFGDDVKLVPWVWLFVVAAGYGAAVIGMLVYRLRRRTGDVQLTKDLLAACALHPLADPTVGAFLDLTAALHPATFDMDAYRFDAALGFQPSAVLAQLGGQAPLAMAAITAVYVSLPYGISVLYALQRTAPRRQPVSIVVFQALSAMMAVLFFYHLYPITGPKYVFGAAFPLKLPDPLTVEGMRAVVAPAPRNGMPSMHFGWALALWLNAHFLGIRWARVLFALMLALTTLATLALGEHFLVDLVVAVPLIVGIQALCVRGVSWDRHERMRAAIGGFGLTLAWILVLRFGVDGLLAVPVLPWLLAALTVGAGIALYRPLAAAAAVAMNRPAAFAPVPAPVSASAAATRYELRYVAAMFVISGFAGLMYQVLFSKSLALTFGSTSTATYTVLATNMGDMAIGAWLGGRIAAHRAGPLTLYASCEFAIAAYCVLTPLIFSGIQFAYVSLATGLAPDAPSLTWLRVLLGAGALTVPTVLMGMTLPILARYFEQRAETLGRSVAMLYGANTLGAALGALLAGYLIMPAVGVLNTTFLAAAGNLLAVYLALRLAGSATATAAAATSPAAIAAGAPPEDRKLGYVALVLLTAGGAVTLALEVKYMHLLAVVAGNSVYAFSLMLFAFLIGLGAGAEGARRLLRLRISLSLAMALLEFVLAAVILLGVYLWDSLPAYFARFEHYPLSRDFGAREVVRGLVCWLAMFPPAVAIGALYPLAMECVGRAWPDRPLQALGRAAALNTVGNILGVLVGGFYMLPALGALRSIQIMAGVCLALGVMVLLVQPRPSEHFLRRAWPWAPACALLLLLAVQPPHFNYTALASGANVYFTRQGYGEVIDRAESVDGGLTTVSENRMPDGTRLLTLLTNGKFQGNNAMKGEMVAQVGFALSPLLHTTQRERALVIGFGTGVSARTLNAAGFRQLDIVDLSADIIRLATEHFSDVNDAVVSKPGVSTFVTDGRNFLMLQQHEYDVVSMEISSIWFAGAASLYNREFYRLVKKRLKPRGVLQQWMQLHHVAPADIYYIVGSMRAEFDYVWLYLIGGQGMLIASNDPGAKPGMDHVAAIDATATLKSLLALYDGSARSLLDMLLLDPAAIDRMQGSSGVPADYWISTDNNLRLGNSTPRGNALDGMASLQRNLELIRSHAAPPAAQ